MHLMADQQEKQLPNYLMLALGQQGSIVFIHLRLRRNSFPEGTTAPINRQNYTLGPLTATTILLL